MRFPCPALLSSLLFGRPGWVVHTRLGARIWSIDWVERDPYHRRPPSRRFDGPTHFNCRCMGFTPGGPISREAMRDPEVARRHVAAYREAFSEVAEAWCAGEFYAGSAGLRPRAEEPLGEKTAFEDGTNL